MSVNWNDTQRLGAFHGAEIPFIFVDDFELLGPGEHDLAVTMWKLWENFAWTGSPNKGPWGSQSTFWSTFDEEDSFKDTGGVNLQFQVNNISTGTGLRKPYCDFWATFKSPFMPWLNPADPSPTNLRYIL